MEHQSANTQTHGYSVMKQLLIVFLIISFSFTNHAKTDYFTVKEAPKKALKKYNQIATHIDRMEYNTAIEEFSKLLKKYNQFIDAYMLKGDLHMRMRDYRMAIQAFEKGVQLDSAYAQLAFLRIAKAQMELEQYAVGKSYLETFLAQKNVLYNYRLQAEHNLRICVFAIDAMANPVSFEPINMGDSINSQLSEYLPAVTADEQTIIFTVNKEIGKYMEEDFFYSEKVDSLWGPAKNLGAPVNTKENEGAQTISPDGRTIYFTACNRKDGYGSCDIYYTTKYGNQWTEPKNIGGTVNSKAWESQPSISSDGNTLYFCSNRKGGVGRKDLWFSQKLPDGTWGTPENLGTQFNTNKDEQCPFIHTDNKTLYFSSNGLLGMGDADLFLSRRDSNGQWAEPKNLGYPINTKANESSLVVSTDGQRAYFASDRFDSRGKLDLYYFEMDPKIKPQPVCYVKGRVTDSETIQPLKAFVELIDLETKEMVTSTHSDRLNGSFLVCLPNGKDYGLNVYKRGYLFHSENFSLKNHTVSKPYFLDIELDKIQSGKKVILNNIFYETDSYELKKESEVELNYLIQFLRTYPIIHIQINGHTDDIGKEEYNLKLSANRAKAVYNYLIDHGIDKKRLRYKGFGATKKIVDNDSETNRAKNRRTEFEIIANR